MAREGERRAAAGVGRAAAAAAGGGGRGRAGRGGELVRVVVGASSQQPQQQDEGNEDDDGIAAAAASQGAPVSREEFDALVAEMVRFMLFKNHQQAGVPVKREELAQLGCKNYKHRFLVGQVIKEAQRKLRTIFGMEMKELIRVRQPTVTRGRANSQAVTEVKTYILRSTVPEALRMKYVDSPEASAISSLALIVVGIIQLAGDSISEENLWLHLQRLGIKEHDDKHPVFGNIKQSVEMIAKQRYIQKERMEGEGFIFKLAERALDDALKAKLNTFISKIFLAYILTGTAV
ncbi:hypothetical protein O6H91_14G026100 [Diphasiastrum complanatum]|uniref:Uncharacterized protein n=1 Tax=Diphasiastrum complanatum TaxID=34168 RepID=A0ACC2BMF8_DIPCM|nr:hypothetical protein O6H91_14G026100 [Diphasiastrum complanatum]